MLHWQKQNCRINLLRHQYHRICRVSLASISYIRSAWFLHRYKEENQFSFLQIIYYIFPYKLCCIVEKGFFLFNAYLYIIQLSSSRCIRLINHLNFSFHFRNDDAFKFKMFDRISFRRKIRKPRLEVPPIFGFGTRSEPENMGPAHQGFENPVFRNTSNDVSTVLPRRYKQ